VRCGSLPDSTGWKVEIWRGPYLTWPGKDMGATRGLAKSHLVREFGREELLRGGTTTQLCCGRCCSFFGEAKNHSDNEVACEL
jgi:hypothetical protein